MRNEIIVDNFAGGGGASTGIAMALGRSVDIAINHDPEAVAMHKANHPDTAHFCESVWDVVPRDLADGRPVGLLWLSPDCKHFSKAKGGQPVERNIRGLAWVALRWVAQTRPRVIMLENVEEFVTWGPLVEGADGKLRPCPQRKGHIFRTFIAALERRGYRVEHKDLRACDFGAPTIRKRLFLIARCDGLPIVWPAPTHGNSASEAVRSGQLAPWRTAAECIDFSLPAHSIFLSKEEGRKVGVNRPLAEATQRRIAKGIMRYVVNAQRPFIVGRHVAAYICTYYGDKRESDVRGNAADEPLKTQTTENRHALVAALLVKHYSGYCTNPAVALGDPLPTITATDHNSLITSNLVKLRGDNVGQAVGYPLATVSAQGTHHAEVRAFLTKYYGSDQDPRLADPLHTVTTKDRFGLVMVGGQPYAIEYIGLRMLAPRELFRAQGFPDTYIIGDNPAQGLKLSKAAQVRMCGNSVCPPVAAALVAANYQPVRVDVREAVNE